MRAPDAKSAPSSAATSLITQQFLAWVASNPRTYGETMEAWRSSCPRLTVWEDAVSDGLVKIKNDGGPMKAARVMLTSRGKLALAQHAKF